MNPVEAVSFIITYTILFMLTGYLLVRAIILKDKVLIYFVILSSAVIWFSAADLFYNIFPQTQYPVFNDALHHHSYLLGQLLLIIYPLFLRKYNPEWYKPVFVYPFVILGAFLVAFYGFSYPLKITGFTENLTFIMSLMVMPIFFGVLILMRLIKTKKKDIFLFSLVFSPILWLLLRLITTFLLIESDSFEVTISNSLFLLVILAFIRQHHSGRNRQENISAPSFYEKFSITPREKEIILLLKEGMSYREIQQELDISFGTVKTHISNIYEKAGVNSRITLLNLLAAYESPEEQ